MPSKDNLDHHHVSQVIIIDYKVTRNCLGVYQFSNSLLFVISFESCNEKNEKKIQSKYS